MNVLLSLAVSIVCNAFLFFCIFLIEAAEGSCAHSNKT